MIPAAVATWFAACGEPESPPVDASLGWLSEVAADPSAFERATAGARSGWIALHAQDLRGAARDLEGDAVGQGRAELALALLQEDLGRLVSAAHAELAAGWRERGNVPASVEDVAALAAACAEGGLPEGGPFATRLAAHAAAREARDPDAVVAFAQEALLQTAEPGFVRRAWDPCVHASLASIWRARGLARLGSAGGDWRSLPALVAPGAGLCARLLSPWPTREDLAAELASARSLGTVGATSPSLRGFGVGLDAIATDDPEAAKDEVRRLDAALDSVRARLDDQAPTEGVAVVRELGLLARFRQEWLAARAREALLGDRPRAAATLLELARDHSARAVGPQNGPALFALAAEARLRLGHVREALDALRALGDEYPEVLGAIEVTGDLAVLRGLDRQGDSKEE